MRFVVGLTTEFCDVEGASGWAARFVAALSLAAGLTSLADDCFFTGTSCLSDVRRLVLPRGAISGVCNKRYQKAVNEDESEMGDETDAKYAGSKNFAEGMCFV